MDGDRKPLPCGELVDALALRHDQRFGRHEEGFRARLGNARECASKASVARTSTAWTLSPSAGAASCAVLRYGMAPSFAGGGARSPSTVRGRLEWSWSPASPRGSPERCGRGCGPAAGRSLPSPTAAGGRCRLRPASIPEPRDWHLPSIPACAARREALRGRRRHANAQSPKRSRYCECAGFFVPARVAARSR